MELADGDCAVTSGVVDGPGGWVLEQPADVPTNRHAIGTGVIIEKGQWTLN